MGSELALRLQVDWPDFRLFPIISGVYFHVASTVFMGKDHSLELGQQWVFNPYFSVIAFMLQDVRALYGNEESSAEVLVQISHHFCGSFSWAGKAALSTGITATVKSLNLFSLLWSYHCDCNYIFKLCPTVSSYLPRRGYLFYPLRLAFLCSGVGNVPLLLYLTIKTWYQLTNNGTFIHTLLLLFYFPVVWRVRGVFWTLTLSPVFQNTIHSSHTYLSLQQNFWERTGWICVKFLLVYLCLLEGDALAAEFSWHPPKIKRFWHGGLEGPSLSGVSQQVSCPGPGQASGFPVLK